MLNIVASAFRVKDGDLSKKWYFDRRFSISVLSIVIILPLLMLKNIGSLSYTRFVANYNDTELHVLYCHFVSCTV